MASAAERLARIAEAHSKHVVGGGLTSGLCVECSHVWPCPTWKWCKEEKDALGLWADEDDF